MNYQPNKDSKIYVAGHKGLVGSAIWQNLRKRGYTKLLGLSREELDLKDPKAVGAFFAAQQPEFVFLAAAKVGGIMANTLYRGQFIYDNLMIQNNVIHAAYQHRVKKLLFLGSTCIYPKEAPQPIPENCLLSAPLEYTNEPYAIAKIAGIKMCESYNIQYGTNFISVMPTNLYGPNDNFDLEKSHVLPALIRKIHLGKCLEDNNWEAIRKDLSQRPVEKVNGESTHTETMDILAKYGVALLPNGTVSVEIWGSGQPMREFLWSEEMADACVYIMEKVNFSDLASTFGSEIRNTHINIGTGKEISIKNLAQLIKQEIGFAGNLNFNTTKPDGTLRKLTDVSKIHALGWHHTMEIPEGIRTIYHWYIHQ